MITNPRATRAYSDPRAMPAKDSWRKVVIDQTLALPVHPVDERGELLGDGGALDLLRSGQLPLLGIALLGEQVEPLDRLDLGQVLVDLADPGRHQLMDFGLGGQVPVR